TGAREGRAGPAESVRRTVAVGSGSERNPLDNIAVAIRHRHTGAFGIGRREQNHEISVGLRVGLVHHAATAGEAAAVRRLRLLGLLLGAGVLGRTDGALGRLRLSGRPRGAHGAAAGVGFDLVLVTGGKRDRQYASEQRRSHDLSVTGLRSLHVAPREAALWSGILVL